MAPIVKTSARCRASTDRRNPHVMRLWIRRTIASRGAASLVWTTFVSEMPWLARVVEAEILAPAGEGCPAKAKTANLSFTLNMVLQGRGNDSFLDAYGSMPAIPVTVLISREGRICAKYQGTKTKEAIEQGIRALP